ncbi:hypothetical protein CDAR_50931 [Caerostris darwini]|uniref:Uncharacterized protein n=1 Tax=Caerostris darwini TaxID=1538125 RepID=A0AAV4U5W2_9ARAC|nr:hypothetical protein CDAR_50931 [Caerostris darwini]
MIPGINNDSPKDIVVISVNTLTSLESLTITNIRFNSYIIDSMVREREIDTAHLETLRANRTESANVYTGYGDVKSCHQFTKSTLTHQRRTVTALTPGINVGSPKENTYSSDTSGINVDSLKENSNFDDTRDQN